MDIKDFIIKNIINHPQDIVHLAMRRYKITRPAVHKHLNVLIKTGKIHAEGTTRNRRYSLTTKIPTTFTLPIDPDIQESAIWEKHLSQDARGLPQNIQDICHYGFTEMLNNVIDHSSAIEVVIAHDFINDPIRITISDNGVGIYKKILTALHLDALRETVLHLTKGKFTTDPEHHSGEGIFFTSRVFDTFSIASDGICFMRYQDTDWSLDDSDIQQGTTISMAISHASVTTLESVFGKYTNPDTLHFDNTIVAVQLALMAGESCVSRSQAKRVLFGLDKFKKIVLDFNNVRFVGQGFVDEVFRVFQNQHPEILISPTNMNENVEFMVKRGLPVP